MITTYVRRRSDGIVAAAGLAVVAAAAVIAHSGTVSGPEEWVFRRLNDLPDGLYPVGWPFMQLGNLAFGPVVALVALILRRWRLALAAVIVTVGKLAAERAVKSFVHRQRPWTSIGDIHARGDVPHHGWSFPSGHAVLLAGLAVIVVPYLPRRARWIPWVLVAANAVMRVYVGAHNPLDVVAGTGLGVTVGALANLIVAVPKDGSADEAPAT